MKSMRACIIQILLKLILYLDFLAFISPVIAQELLKKEEMINWGIDKNTFLKDKTEVFPTVIENQYRSNKPYTINNINFVQMFYFLKQNSLSKITFTTKFDNERTLEEKCVDMYLHLNHKYGIESQNNKLNYMEIKQHMLYITEHLWNSLGNSTLELVCISLDDKHMMTIALTPKWQSISCSYNVESKLVTHNFYLDEWNGGIREFNKLKVTPPLTATFEQDKIMFYSMNEQQKFTIDLITGKTTMLIDIVDSPVELSGSCVIN